MPKRFCPSCKEPLSFLDDVVECVSCGAIIRVVKSYPVTLELVDSAATQNVPELHGSLSEELKSAQLAASVKRPPTVWITQIIAIIILLLTLAGIIVPLISATLSDAHLVLFPQGIWGFTTRAVRAAAFIATSFFAFWGLQKRKTYGKWSGVMLMVLLIIDQAFSEDTRMLYSYLLYGKSQLGTLPPPYLNYSSEGEVIGAITANASIMILSLCLVLRLAFARSVSKYFENDASRPARRV